MIELKPGMEVFIKVNAHHTDRTYSLVPKMRQFLGTVQQIQSVDYDCIKIQNYNWSRKDLMLIDLKSQEPISEKIKPVLFSESEVVGE